MEKINKIMAIMSSITYYCYVQNLLNVDCIRRKQMTENTLKTKNEDKLERVYRILNDIRSYLESRRLNDEISRLLCDGEMGKMPNRKRYERIKVLLDHIQTAGTLIESAAPFCRKFNLEPWMEGARLEHTPVCLAAMFNYGDDWRAQMKKHSDLEDKKHDLYTHRAAQKLAEMNIRHLPLAE